MTPLPPREIIVHPSACVDASVSIGEGAQIWHFCHVMTGARIGAGTVLGQSVFVGAGVVVGNGCRVQNNVSLYSGVTLEDDVFCGPSCVFTNVKRPRAWISQRERFSPTLIRRGATLGANATILCGVTVGSYALVAAGAVVTRDVPAYALAAGAPARVVGFVDEDGQPLPEGADGARVGASGQIYVSDGEGGLMPVQRQGAGA